jgi:mono/diheme cytochrome c family protein
MKAVLLLVCATALAMAGCRNAPGHPPEGFEARRPDQILDFPTLYAENCAACHGRLGKNGAAISLANPVYLTYAGAANIERITSAGVSGTLMPPFARSHGGMLTDRQIQVLTTGMMTAWAGPADTAIPAYTASSPGDAVEGQKVFAGSCGRCHGADGTGASIRGGQAGSLVDPAYLLRSLIVAGQPEQGMPDWRSDGSRPLTEPEITGIVAWLAQHRTAAPGQIYRQHP